MPQRITVLAFVAALMGSVCMLDVASGPGSEMCLLYLAPIGVASFVFGARYGYALTLLASLLQFLTSGVPGSAYPSIAAFVSDHGAAASVYVVVAYVVGVMRMLGRPSVSGGPIDALTRPK